VCNNCASRICAEPSAGYKKNRIWVSICAVVGVPLASIFAAKLPFPPIEKVVFGLALYAALICIVSIRGHHLMDFRKE